MVRPMAFTPALGEGSTSSRKEKRKEERKKTVEITEVLIYYNPKRILYINLNAFKKIRFAVIIYYIKGDP